MLILTLQRQPSPDELEALVLDSPMGDDEFAQFVRLSGITIDDPAYAQAFALMRAVRFEAHFELSTGAGL